MMMNEQERLARQNNWIPIDEVFTQAYPLLQVLRKVFPDFDNTYHEVAGGEMSFVNTFTGDISHAKDWSELLETQQIRTPHIYCYSVSVDNPTNDLMKLVRWHDGQIVAEPVVALDYYGEKKPMFQLMVYNDWNGLDGSSDIEEDEPQVQIRFDHRGKIVEVVVGHGVEIIPFDTPDVSPWLIERDGR